MLFYFSPQGGIKPEGIKLSECIVEDSAMHLIIKRTTVTVLCALALFFNVTVMAMPSNSVLTTSGLMVAVNVLAHPPVTGDCISCHPAELPESTK